MSSSGTLVACPQCTSGDVSQLLSTFSARTVGGDQPAPAPLGRRRRLLRRWLRLPPLEREP